MEAFERVARAAVAEASAVLRATWRGRKTVEYKGEVDIVTEIDREVEALITEHLRRAFPEHLMISEEAATGTIVAPAPADRHVWYVDPLDGTTNFVHAYPNFAISMALAFGTEVLFGLVHDPIRDETFVAHRGGGARLNDTPIAVSTVDVLADALVATGFPYDRRSHLEFYLGFFADFVARAQGVRRNGAAALDLCYVACGRLDGFFEWKLRPWDTAAGTLIVREAGGMVSDFRGGRFDLFGDQTFASNGRLHDAMAQVLSARLARVA